MHTPHFHNKPSTFRLNDLNLGFIRGERYAFAAFAIKYAHVHSPYTQAMGSGVG